LETATIDFDIREIGIEESAIDKSTARKFTLTEITLLESAASEFSIAQILLGSSNILKHLILENFCGEIHREV